MQRVIPAFRVSSAVQAKAFYLEQLGFRLDWEHQFAPGFPIFMQVQKDGMKLFLTEHEGDAQMGGLVHLMVEDVDQVHQEFLSRCTPITEGPHEGIPGLRSMTVTDPDGNQLRWMTHLA